VGGNSEFRIPNSEFGIQLTIYTAAMNFLTPPLARWDGLHLVLDLDRIERHLNVLLEGSDSLRDLKLAGRADGLGAELTVVWNGVPARVGLDVTEIRLRHRYLGLRMRRLRALGGVRVPRAAVELGLRALDNPLLKVFRGQGIVVVDLGRWIPEEADVRIVTVQSVARTASVWFGPGSLVDLPSNEPPALPAGDLIE
jgi:hypothetical protein